MSGHELPPIPRDGDDRPRTGSPSAQGGSLDTLLEHLGMPARGTWQPILARLSRDELPRLAAVCRRRGVVLVDPIDGQLAELAAVRLPGAGAEERAAFIEETVSGAGGATAYGCWIFLPWRATVVHVLPEDAYFDVITSRNHDKITPGEQRALRRKRVGVMGLSVGAEAAVAVAQEHLCGEIRLADFDALELSNLNRIGAGVDELGEAKVVLAARRIAGIDPYLRVSVFSDGIDESTMEAFLDGLDLLLEECDDLRMKFVVRQRARALGVNLVFAADERGFLSVEPYGDVPDLPPFHGLVRSAPRARAGYSSQLAYLRALTEWLGGWDELTDRSRASVEQIGRTLCGYPQLAGEARFAAGQLAHVARRLLLGERVPPFAGHLDLAALVPAEQVEDARGPWEEPADTTEGRKPMTAEIMKGTKAGEGGADDGAAPDRRSGPTQPPEAPRA